MRALVTGGAGFIGSAIVRALTAEGAQVRVLDSFLTGFEDNVPEGADLVVADLRDVGAVRAACKGAEVVFHQGAVRSVPRSVEEPALVHESNASGTLNVLLAAEETGVRRVVYASSSSVYGENENPVQREEQPPNPISPYGVSKLAGEYYCRVWSRLKGLSTVSLRYFNVFGPGQHPESKYAAVFPAFVSALLGERTPEVHWDGEQSRDFTYIDDVVRANLCAAKAGPEADGAVCNIGSGAPKSVNEVLRAVSDAVGTWVEPERTPRRAGDVRSTHADISRAKDLLGWGPEAAWEDAVQRTVEWFRTAAPASR